MKENLSEVQQWWFTLIDLSFIRAHLSGSAPVWWGWCSPTSQGQKLLHLGTFQISPHVSLHSLCALLSRPILYNKLVNKSKCFLKACESFRRLMASKQGAPPICSHIKPTSRVSWGPAYFLRLASEAGRWAVSWECALNSWGLHSLRVLSEMNCGHPTGATENCLV